MSAGPGWTARLRRKKVHRYLVDLGRGEEEPKAAICRTNHPGSGRVNIVATAAARWRNVTTPGVTTDMVPTKAGFRISGVKSSMRRGAAIGTSSR